MSVLERYRNTSKYKFYTNATRLRKEITQLMLRDFGLKRRVRELHFDTRNMKPEDVKQLIGMMERYGLSVITSEYPTWIIDKFRDSFWDILRDMHVNITRAYSIWATNFSEAVERRNAQNRAIAACENLLQEMTFAIDILDVDAEKYMRYVDLIAIEINLLKGWRKADNKRFKELKREALKHGHRLSAVVSSSRFANANNNGNANNNAASNANGNGGVRPYSRRARRANSEGSLTGNEPVSVPKG